ncbi:hypothetical protein VTJ49DRAFT_6302 [Mycothermus thermophilus]|uniref:Survival Motor Neuron Gemin2-binding domain-containing protein n=1 Tax=Humicola insolens TaxID=85995 RepID=A0ABR3V1J2_HUMIN
MESETAANHDEIWDDSALVNSWNEALDEYKKYHSIHLSGGNIDEILDGVNGVTPETRELPARAARKLRPGTLFQ